MGLRVRGIHLGEARTISNSWGWVQLVHESIDYETTDETIDETTDENIAGIARDIARNIHQTYWDLLEYK